MDKLNIKLLNSIEDKLIRDNRFVPRKKFPKIYREYSFIFKKKGDAIKDIESNWYMHQNLSEIEEFRKIYASYKKDLKPQKIKVKIIKNSEKK